MASGAVGPPHDERETALAKADRRLADDPVDVQALFERANLLRLLNRAGDAQGAYLRVLALDHAHEGALNNLATLLHETGYRSAAKTTYGQAVALHPDRPMGRVNLGNLLREEGALADAKAQFEAALTLDPDHAEAHRGLGQALEEMGLPDEAWPHHERAYRGRAVRALPYRGRGEALTVLTAVSARGGNIPMRFILDQAEVRQIALVAEFADPDAPLPEHDVIFNAVGDADVCHAGLENLDRLLARAERPVINPPARVLATGRAGVAETLKGIEGLRVPAMLALPREAWRSATAAEALAEAGLGFPLLLRALGFHTGQHFVRLESAQDLQPGAAVLPGRDLLAIEPLNAQGADGLHRKYRVMALGGALFPLHLAISRQWKVHYFTAAMAEDAAFRAEEAAFLKDMHAALGPAAVSALERAAAALSLDYAGMDFGLDADGKVLLFEANATMVINPPEPDPMWDYRRPAVARALAAAKALVVERAAQPRSFTGAAPST